MYLGPGEPAKQTQKKANEWYGTAGQVEDHLNTVNQLLCPRSRYPGARQPSPCKPPGSTRHHRKDDGPQNDEDNSFHERIPEGYASTWKRARTDSLLRVRFAQRRRFLENNRPRVAPVTCTPERPVSRRNSSMKISVQRPLIRPPRTSAAR